jgi:S-adenosylmethionine hydrolase
MSHPLITLTTDFGLADSYVGAMKGVMLSICPEAMLVDITHEIAPQAVRQAAYVLSTAAPYFPPGCVHLVVVDPGVGSERRPIVVKMKGATYVAPDNGVLSLALAQDRDRPGGDCLAVLLAEPRYRLQPTSATFHGRDIFAPAAAYLASGVDPVEMGDEIPFSSLVSIGSLRPVLQADGSWSGEVLHIDRFGNLVTNFEERRDKGQGDARDKFSVPPSKISVTAGGVRIRGVGRTFSDVGRGELVSYVGSSGHLEIAERDGSAATRLGVRVGDPIHVKGTATELLFGQPVTGKHH